MWDPLPVRSCNPSDGGPVSLVFTYEVSRTLVVRTPVVVTVTKVGGVRHLSSVSTRKVDPRIPTWMSWTVSVVDTWDRSSGSWEQDGEASVTTPHE